MEEVEFPVGCGAESHAPLCHETVPSLPLGPTLTDREGALTFDRGRRRGETGR
jgi:hypothetical protein